jgi:uncharacterized RDD family membrane protein YckC
MRCSPCGAFYEERSVRCPECGAIQEESAAKPSQQSQPESEIVEEATLQVRKSEQKRPVVRKRANTSLIEFPGANRSALPEWRKELVERVREVQERRAREAALEAGASEPLFSQLDEVRTIPSLELLSQAEAPPLNPIVVKALRRLERARAQPVGNAAYATAVAYQHQPEMDLEPAPAADAIVNTKPERVHNLAVVPTPSPKAELSETTNVATSEPAIKPRRIIDDQNDPALNYLDSIPTTVTVDRSEYRAASIFRRIFSAIADLVVVGLFSSPFLALAEFTNMDWRSLKVIGFAAATFLVVGFLYLTVSIAFTGRTLGMKLFSLRVVDARTGLIPTGGQSAGRAFVYMLSLAAAGIALMYAFVDSDKYTAHDRVTHTAVIRV